MRSGFPTRPALFGKTTWSPHGSDGGAGKNPHEGFGTDGTREAMKLIVKIIACTLFNISDMDSSGQGGTWNLGRQKFNDNSKSGPIYLSL